MGSILLFTINGILAMPIIKQESFALGQVDQRLQSDTGSPFYTKAVAEASNVLVTDVGQLKSRSGTSPYRGFKFEDASQVVDDDEVRMFHIEGIDLAEASSTLLLYYSSKALTLRILGDAYFVVLKPSSNEVPPLFEISIAISGGFIVLTHRLMHPRLVELLSNGTFRGFGGDEDPFSMPVVVPPAVRDVALDQSYRSSAITFTATPPGGGQPLWTIVVASGDQMVSLPKFKTLDSYYVAGGAEGGGIAYGVIVGGSEDGTTLLVTPIEAFRTMGSVPTDSSAWTFRSAVFFSGGTFPSACAFYEGRLWLAGGREQPSLIAASKIGTLDDFSLGVGRESDGIVVSLSSEVGGRITQLIGGLALNVFTTTNSLIISSGTNSIISPTNIRSRIVSSHGCPFDVSPVLYRNSIYFIGTNKKELYRVVETPQNAVVEQVSAFFSDLLDEGIVNLSLYSHGTGDVEDPLLLLFTSSGSIVAVNELGDYQQGGIRGAVQWVFDTQAIDASGSSVDFVMVFKSSVVPNTVIFRELDSRHTADGVIIPRVANAGDPLYVEGTVTLILESDYFETGGFVDVFGDVAGSYAGRFQVAEDMDTSTQYVRFSEDIATPTFNAWFVGKRFKSHVRTLPCLASRDSSFQQVQVGQVWVEYSEAYELTVGLSAEDGLGYTYDTQVERALPFLTQLDDLPYKRVSGVASLLPAMGSSRRQSVFVSSYNLMTIQAISYSSTSNIWA